MFNVYAKDAVLGEKPLCFVNRETRDLWIADGAAVFVGRRSIRLKLNLPPTPQQSVVMGPAVIEACMMRKRWALATAAEWRSAA